MFNKYILHLVYNRPCKTEQVLENLQKLYGISEYKLIVVRQDGNKEVKDVIDRINWIDTLHYVTDYDPGVSIKSRINQNMRLGISKAFDAHHADYIVIIEDDILLGYDFLHFCDLLQLRYRSDKDFRAINAFSKEKFDMSRIADYGKFRYGVGKGWSINRKVWEKLKIFWKEGIDEHFDVLIEPWIRKGFVIMPYCSRSMDIGWGGGSHTPENEEDEYYRGMKKSWVGDSSFELVDYRCVKNMQYSWRSDCYQFRKVDLEKIKRRIRKYVSVFERIINKRLRKVFKS
jgi:hypothetical protein